MELAAQQTTEAPFPYDRDIFCSGHNVLADGRLFLAGGHDHTTGHRQDVVGIDRCDLYDPSRTAYEPILASSAPQQVSVSLGSN